MREPIVSIRFKIFIAFTAFVVLIIFWQYVSLMLLTEKKEVNSTTMKPAIERGPILDRNGRVLAVQTLLYSVTAWVPGIDNPRETAYLLSDILDLQEEKLLFEFNTSRGFLYVKRKISPTESEKIKKLKDKGKLKGISLEPEYGRNYPERELASHILGYVGTDNLGLSGLEYSFEEVLSPKPVDENTGKTFGNQIFLTIDLNVQYFTRKLAEELYTEHKADSVMILVMQANSGEFLSYVSLPSFDPNTFLKYPESARINRPVAFAYEPGSVFKVFSISSFLELGGITLQDHFYCNGYYEMDVSGRETERIQCLGIHGDVTPQKIIQYSCNAGAAYASERVDSESFYHLLQLFGFGNQTGLPFSGESYGLLRSPQQWSFRSKPTIAMGQEISVTAVQVVTAATALANEGILLKPHIVKKIVSSEGKILKENVVEPVRRVISERVANEMLLMMETATEPAGTATRAAIEGMRISAKTGTAQMIDYTTGKYSKDSYIASCLAIFPTDDPEIIVYVVIVNPKAGEYFGGRIAAPAVKKLGEELIRYYGIPEDGSRVIEHPGRISIKTPDPVTFKDHLPDLRGYSKRQILPLFQNQDLDVVIKGEGHVVNQSPPPGTLIKKGMRVILELQ